MAKSEKKEIELLSEPITDADVETKVEIPAPAIAEVAPKVDHVFEMKPVVEPKFDEVNGVNLSAQIDPTQYFQP